DESQGAQRRRTSPPCGDGPQGEAAGRVIPSLSRRPGKGVPRPPLQLMLKTLNRLRLVKTIGFQAGLLFRLREG
ncbi:MAG: hypothetical protein AB2598_20595, partial [Candidatus Thiodiazotropha sp.]